MNSKPISLRLPQETREWLERFHRGRGSLSGVAARLLEEARRQSLFPGVSFLDTRAGRRAGVEGSSLLMAEVWRWVESRGFDAAGVASHFGWSAEKAGKVLLYVGAFGKELQEDAEDLGLPAVPREGTTEPSEKEAGAPEGSGWEGPRISHPFASLIDAAKEARLRAYAPYSGFRVGAALLGKGWQIYPGCNVENLSFGLTICAERNAIQQAVVAGCREFEAIAVVAETRLPVSPCGACRQVMAEFGSFKVILATLAGEVFESTVDELLPRSRTGILDRD